MQALVLSNGRVSFDAGYPVPEPDEGEALVRVRLAGICATDLEIIKGYAGFKGIFGHEFVGVVEKVNQPAGAPSGATTEWLGRRVVGTINLGCGACPNCLRQGPEHCPHRTVLGIIERDGAFAEYLTLPLANLHAIPDSVPDEAAVFTEPLAAAVRIGEQLIISPHDKVAIVGPGRLGLLVAQVLALAGTQVIVLGRRQSSLALPTRLGMETGLVEEIPDDSFDYVVETAGNEAGLAHSLRLVRPLGTIVLKSTFHGAANIDLTRVVVGEITVIGSRCGPFPAALRLLRQGKIITAPLISAEYPLADGVAALAYASEPSVRKVLLRLP